MSKDPVAWITAEDLVDMQAHAIIGVNDWSLTVGLQAQKDDVPLYTHPSAEQREVDCAVFARRLERELA